MLISKNKGKMWKKALCLIFAFLLSINSFAAIVSDNDGSAFVTKAEFDALKKDFADQITNYNDSIDSKIDGAIAAYLAGMRLTKKELIPSYLNKNGLYGQLYTYWSSSTTGAFDQKSTKKGVMNSTFSTYEWDWSNSSRTWYSGHTGTTWSLYLKSSAPNCWDLNETDYKYITSKKTKFKEDDGSETICYQRAKLYTVFDFIAEQYTEYFNVFTGANPWTPSAGRECLRNAANVQKFVQDASNVWIDYYRNGGTTTKTWSTDKKFEWLLLGVVSIDTHDETDTLDENIVYPLSTQNDYYWDPTIKNESIVWDSGDGYPAAKSSTINNSSISGNSWVKSGTTGWSITPKTPVGYSIPWLQKYTISNDMILYDWKTTHKANNKIKNGLILCSIEQDCELEIEFKADQLGTIYLYSSKTPTNTWTEASVVSKEVTDLYPLTTKLKMTDVKKGDYIWMRYLPTDTNVIALVGIDSIISEAE